MSAESEQKPTEITPEQHKAAVKEYHSAKGKDAKSEVVKKFPFLKHVFSEVNHS